MKLAKAIKGSKPRKPKESCGKSLQELKEAGLLTVRVHEAQYSSTQARPEYMQDYRRRHR